MIQLDETHDANRKSWVASANVHAQGHGDFPIQNLPLGIFSVRGDTPRGGAAIGDEVFDLKAACEAKLFTGDAEKAARAASATTLNDLMALGAGPRVALRKQLSALLPMAPPNPNAHSRWPLRCCTRPPIVRCTCPRRSARSLISLPASRTPKTAASAAARIRR